MKYILLAVAIATFTFSFSQTNNDGSTYQNTADKLLASDGNLTIGGYGEVHYNQVFDKNVRHNGILDVHRIVMFLGYNFNEKTQFVSEVEYEYTKELWVEQAFIQHKLNNYINLQAGLMLIPMGIINQYHEPTTFHGVERPIIDNKIAPSTWREVGLGFNGTILPASLKYQIFLVNGPVSYDGTNGLMNGDKGIREGRQKGSKSYMSSPNYTGRVEYYGTKGLNVGLSAYLGNSQSKLYNQLDKSNEAGKLRADSSIVGIAMLGIDSRYQNNGFECRGQFYYTSLSNTKQYNEFTKKNGTLNDLGSSMLGYYIEAGYNILKPFSQTNYELIPFVRYMDYNTHNSVESNIASKDKYAANAITTGLTLKLHSGVVVKTDIDFAKSKADIKRTTTFNAGVGVMF